MMLTMSGISCRMRLPAIVMVDWIVCLGRLGISTIVVALKRTLLACCTCAITSANARLRRESGLQISQMVTAAMHAATASLVMSFMVKIFLRLSWDGVEGRCESSLPRKADSV